MKLLNFLRTGGDMINFNKKEWEDLQKRFDTLYAEPKDYNPIIQRVLIIAGVALMIVTRWYCG